MSFETFGISDWSAPSKTSSFGHSTPFTCDKVSHEQFGNTIGGSQILDLLHVLV